MNTTRPIRHPVKTLSEGFSNGVKHLLTRIGKHCSRVHSMREREKEFTAIVGW